MEDITLISVPYTVVENPPLGIAVLKGALESEGLSCTTMDLGMELYFHCGQDRLFFDLVQQYLSLNTVADSRVVAAVEEFIDHWAHVLVARQSRWIGISVFSYYAHHANFLLCQRIKQLAAKQKIVLGGPGTNTKIHQNLWDDFRITGMEKMIKYGEILKKRGLADEIILGDGEQALIDLLRNDWVAEGFHMEPYRDQERAHAYANFDDFNLSSYQGQLNRGYPQLPIFSSKGCVRNCDFCDVGVVQNRFRFRNGKNIVNEMIYLADRYGIRDFIFLDSLANGSLKSLREWVTELAQYNEDHPDKRITWSASGWICRPIGQMAPSFYKTLAQSGLQSVSIGVESGSNAVLDAINKKTNVEALYYEAEQFRKNNIKFIGLMIVGHWAEHWEDFLETAVMVYKLSRYARTGHLVALDPGGTFKIIDGTPADLDTDKNKLIKHKKEIWWTPLNPGLTAKARYFRLVLLERLMNELKVPCMQQVTPGVKMALENAYDDIEEFYTKVLSEINYLPENQGEYYFDHFDEFLDLVIQKAGIHETVDIEFELESSVTNDDAPMIDVMINNKLIFSSSLQEGTHSVKLDSVAVESENTLQLRFYNKKPHDTITDNEGNIIKDKFVKIKKFIVDHFDLFDDQDFFYTTMRYTENGSVTDVRPGFWFNDSCMELTFCNPFDLWYNRTSNRFSKFDAFIVTLLTLPNARQITDYDVYRQELVQLLRKMTY